jgi:hypothetical protein
MTQNIFYPIFIRLFYKHKFKHESYKQLTDNLNISLEEITFYLASFILPKQAVNSIEFNENDCYNKIKYNEVPTQMSKHVIDNLLDEIEK